MLVGNYETASVFGIESSQCIGISQGSYNIITAVIYFKTTKHLQVHHIHKIY